MRPEKKVVANVMISIVNFMLMLMVGNFVF